MTKDYSEEALFKFLDYVAEKEIVKKETVRSRRTSARRLLSLVDESEKHDLRNIDIDHLGERFADLEGTGFRPESLNTYQSRLKAALTDFFAYTDNPLKFKPSSSPRSTRRKISEGRSQRVRIRQQETKNPEREDANSTDIESSISGGLVFPIPLRDDLVIKLYDVPADLTEAEADKIAAVVRALAVKVT